MESMDSIRHALDKERARNVGLIALIRLVALAVMVLAVLWLVMQNARGWQQSLPIFVGHLAAATRELVGLPFGLYHAAAEGECTWAEFAEAIFEEAGLACRVRRIMTAEFGARASRPALSILRSEKGAPELPHWRDGLTECLAAIAQQGS